MEKAGIKAHLTKAPPVEDVDVPRLEDKDRSALNESIAIYNHTGNVLAAWSVLRFCIQHQRPLPDGIAAFFESIAEKLLHYSATDQPRARELVADLVLRTRNQGGGRSVFQQYKHILEQRELLKLIDDEMVHRVLDRSETKTSVYQHVSKTSRKDFDYFRKLHEQSERGLGSFSVRAVQRASRRGGISEL